MGETGVSPPEHQRLVERLNVRCAAGMAPMDLEQTDGCWAELLKDLDLPMACGRSGNEQVLDVQAARETFAQPGAPARPVAGKAFSNSQSIRLLQIHRRMPPRRRTSNLSSNRWWFRAEHDTCSPSPSCQRFIRLSAAVANRCCRWKPALDDESPDGGAAEVRATVTPATYYSGPWTASRLTPGTRRRGLLAFEKTGQSRGRGFDGQGCGNGAGVAGRRCFVLPTSISTTGTVHSRRSRVHHQRRGVLWRRRHRCFVSNLLTAMTTAIVAAISSAADVPSC